MIKSLSIKNFRGLDGLHVQDFGRVNLITGANNVGKTALLEALHIAEVAPSANPIYQIITWREAQGPNVANNINYAISLKRLFTGLDTSIPIELDINTDHGKAHIQLEILRDPQKILAILIKDMGQAVLNGVVMDNTVLEVTLKKGNVSDSRALIVGANGLVIGTTQAPSDSIYLATRMRYFNLEEAERLGKWENAFGKDKLVTLLQNIDPSLKDISVRVESGITQVYGYNGLWLPFAHFGDSINRMMSLMLAIGTNPNGTVCIDEIENGLHHSTLKHIWRSIHELAVKANVQIFATTHSEECIEAANEVFSTPELQDDFRFHRLQKINSKLTVSSYGTDILGSAIDMGLELRGQTMVRVP